MTTDAGCDRFLTVITVDKAGYITGFKFFDHAPLELSNGFHCAIVSEHIRLAHRRVCFAIPRSHIAIPITSSQLCGGSSTLVIALFPVYRERQ